MNFGIIRVESTSPENVLFRDWRSVCPADAKPSGQCRPAKQAHSGGRVTDLEMEGYIDATGRPGTSLEEYCISPRIDVIKRLGDNDRPSPNEGPRRVASADDGCKQKITFALQKARVLFRGPSHDTKKSYHVTHPIRLRYSRRKLGFS
jgi:hypothetical protein